LKNFEKKFANRGKMFIFALSLASDIAGVKNMFNSKFIEMVLKKIVKLEDVSLPFDELTLGDDELFVITGAATAAGTGSGCHCGCAAGSTPGSGKGCNCD
jgi:hypothetical protein